MIRVENYIHQIIKLNLKTKFNVHYLDNKFSIEAHKCLFKKYNLNLANEFYSELDIELLLVL